MKAFRPFLALQVVLLLVALFTSAACERSPDSTSKPVPADLQQAITLLSQGFETFDTKKVLAVYVDDFTSGTGRSKQGVGEVLKRLGANNVTLAVEKVDVKVVDNTQAEITTYMRLRYNDRFRDIGEGEVVITDVLSHMLRKTDGQWGIYTDKRLATYREGRFGERSPNVTVELPDQLPTDFKYPITVSVQPERKIYYHVSIGNYPEDPGILPQPDIVTMLPEEGKLEAHLLPNPQGLSEMVRVTVIAQDSSGRRLGATTISKLVPGKQRTKRLKQPPPSPQTQQGV